MSQWDYIHDPWVGAELEMNVYALRKARKHLGDGGRLFVRTIMSGITRYSVVEQGPGEHDRTAPSGAVMSVSVDLPTILPGELNLDRFASALDLHKRMFISRTGVFRETFPTVWAFQFPPSVHFPDGDSSLGGGNVPRVNSTPSLSSPVPLPLLVPGSPLLLPRVHFFPP